MSGVYYEIFIFLLSKSGHLRYTHAWSNLHFGLLVGVRSVESKSNWKNIKTYESGTSARNLLLTKSVILSESKNCISRIFPNYRQTYSTPALGRVFLEVTKRAPTARLYFTAETDTRTYITGDGNLRVDVFDLPSMTLKN